jgi:hypothetical protein
MSEEESAWPLVRGEDCKDCKDSPCKDLKRDAPPSSASFFADFIFVDMAGVTRK